MLHYWLTLRSIRRIQKRDAKKGLRTWMAYWCAANEKGRVEYKCSLTDVMKWVADEDRETYSLARKRKKSSGA